MPTYEYRCKDCEHHFETIQKMTDDPLTECPKCNGELVRLLFPVGIMFKGSGFHVNDYPTSGCSSTADSKSATKDDKKSDKETASAPK